MLTQFERIPDAFVTKYDPELQEWAAKFGRWGAKCHIPLRGRTAGVPLLDEHGKPPLIVVTLRAAREGTQMVVRPANPESEDLIKRHVAAMLS